MIIENWEEKENIWTQKNQLKSVKMHLMSSNFIATI